MAAAAELEEAELAPEEHQVVAVTPALARAAAELRKTSNARFFLTCRALRLSERAAICCASNSTKQSGTKRERVTCRRGRGSKCPFARRGTPSREF